MIYKEHTSTIPQDSKRDVNSKVLHIIETNDLQGLTKQDIYEAYSPLGAIHGLNFYDYNSFSEYTTAKKDFTKGQYFTPQHTCKLMVDILNISKNDIVCDLTVGSGNFINVLPNQYNVYGCEFDNNAYRVAKFLYPNANLECNDVRDYKPNIEFDYMTLNPPFNLNFGGVSSQHYICNKAYDLLKPLGIIGLIVPSSYMKDEMMNKKDIDMMNDNFSFLGQIKLSDTEFLNMGVSSFETKMMFFQKRSKHIKNISYSNTFTTKDNVLEVVKMAKKDKLENSFKTRDEVRGDDVFKFKVNKYLYEFKTHDKLKHYYTKSVELLNKFNTQKIPSGMDYKTWEKTKLTEAKVLGVFKRVMCDSYKEQKDVIRLVKKNKSFYIKGYSNKLSAYVNKVLPSSDAVSINDLVVDENHILYSQIESLGLVSHELKKVVGRKRKDYLLHSKNISDLTIDTNIDVWLKDFRFISRGKECQLHDLQRLDMNKVLQRKRTFLNWEMGTGKSVAMLCYIKYLQEFGTQKNIFITAPAIAVDLTLIDFLRSNGVVVNSITKPQHLDNVEVGEVMIMTLGRLSNNKEKVKSFIKNRSNKVAFIFDESDEISNYSSKRTKAVLNAFRRCDNKLLMTGTITRNNLQEFYPNYELMYNNSYNMMCVVERIYKQNSKTKKIKDYENKRFNRPFDGYFGNSTFKNCFSPSKSSVFGIEKKTQDVYNSNELKNIINSSVITRTFEEIAGKKFEYKTFYVKPTPSERHVQRTILDKFHEICYDYFNRTDNDRKESYLRIIRMITLLIKSTSTPQLFKEWDGGNVLPTKYTKTLKMLSEKNEKVLVGCVGIDATQSYYDEVVKSFPNRKVFYVDGTLSFKKRKQIKEEFEETENGIIVANQASLKSAVNIPSCDEVILVGLQWNFSKINQFCFRCIRFDSENITNVNIICYEDTIELNVLNLILNKERVNNFIKTTELTDETELYDKYDVDSNVLGNLMTKHIDENGGMQLGWNEKEIIKN